MYPADFLYSKDHEWIAVDGGVGTIGITDFAQKELGDVVYVELPAVGKKLAVRDSLGSVESVKAVSDIYCPVRGEVTEVNRAVVDEPEMLNQDPHGKAWLIKIKLESPDDLKGLMKAAAYESYIAAAKGH
jgi:glycine cleavage system H protein